ncbi:MAG: hypothetical protein OQJ89_02220 [Kangiellaceae bacterium]|nr:hypothetical protein [Kangiellaceae bacterium]MCW9015760.1 hypothetical protein [Kangiellaceae bacterium]
MKRSVIFFVLVLQLSLTGSAEETPIEIQSNIIGDKEQPLVSYFIPWEEIGTPDKLQWDLDSKFDKTLSLVDRKVLLRSSSMYEHMKLEQQAPKSNEAL